LQLTLETMITWK